MRYLVVVEEGPTSFGAYVPDLAGCVAVGETRNEVLALIKEAPSNFILEVCGTRESRYPVLTYQANSWTFKLPDPALVREATNRAAGRRFIRWAAVDPPW